jgi:hypothetical protein
VSCFSNLTFLGLRPCCFATTGLKVHCLHEFLWVSEQSLQKLRSHSFFTYFISSQKWHLSYPIGTSRNPQKPRGFDGSKLRSRKSRKSSFFKSFENKSQLLAFRIPLSPSFEKQENQEVALATRTLSAKAIRKHGQSPMPKGAKLSIILYRYTMFALFNFCLL